MKPEDARPSKFNNFKVLYNDGSFSIAWGNGDDDPDLRLTMRWNQDDTDPADHGYPVQGRNPLWFDVPDHLAELILRALSTTQDPMLKKHVKLSAIEEALKGENHGQRQ